MAHIAYHSNSLQPTYIADEGDSQLGDCEHRYGSEFGTLCNDAATCQCAQCGQMCCDAHHVSLGKHFVCLGCRTELERRVA